MFPLAATKDLTIVKRPDLIEQILTKFDYIANFNKHKKELPDVPAEDLEHIEELLEDDVNMERGSRKHLERPLRKRPQSYAGPNYDAACS
ncbi:hypothetical protein JB92DRAFT_3121502 [Gautieria morchelliformis]|nr:hypothetical protein JB92DRAFT_3121502 [Gautieria morchelliformis]